MSFVPHNMNIKEGYTSLITILYKSGLLDAYLAAVEGRRSGGTSTTLNSATILF
jgi:hypothetical protein